MPAGRVPCKAYLWQEVRLPISTYEQAVRRLVQYRVDEAVSDEAYFLAVEIVSDVFWKSDRRVRRDVIVAAREIGVM